MRPTFITHHSPIPIATDHQRTAPATMKLLVSRIPPAKTRTPSTSFQVFIFLAASAFAADEPKKNEKRGLLGLGYGGYEYAEPISYGYSGLGLGYGKLGYEGIGLGYGGYAAAPIYKTVAAAPIIKTVAAAAPAPIIAKTYSAPIIAAPAPIIKSYAAPAIVSAPLSYSGYSLGGYGGYGGYGYTGYGGYGGYGKY